MRWLVRPPRGDRVFEEDGLALGSRQHVAVDQPEERVEVDSAKVGMDLVDVFTRDRGRRVVDGVLERGLAPPLLGAPLGEIAVCGHETTGTSTWVRRAGF